MSLHDIMTSIMVRKGLTAAMEIRNYVQTADKDSVSKQAWLKARQNLNPEVFSLRNDYYMKNFYESKNEVKLWKDYLVLAIDGSKTEIPNSEENIHLRTRKLKNLQIEIEKYTLPVRKSKSQKKQYNKANKYACNLKPSNS